MDDVARWAEGHDFSEEIADSVPNDDAVENPMITTSLRLPRTVMRGLRAAADERGVRVTALMREWLEERLGAEAEAEDVFVSAADVRRLIAVKGHPVRELTAGG
ncbi:hypothetical protein [Nocardiopsis trehalosi]|uniref:hypothetical protein n=1 Tax=Nocardiopsis trehalosi TaxID=109329 RepID=UPI0012F93914|nr:hypothetical protein [Nocardiopsis trehalosi]